MKKMVGLCRLCASFRKMDGLIIINDENNEICKKLRKCCQLNILLQDTLPKSVCQECLGNLNVSYKFFLKVQEAQETLQTLFPSCNTEEDGDNEPWISFTKTMTAATVQNKRKIALTNKIDVLRCQEDDKTIKKDFQTQRQKITRNKEIIAVENVTAIQMQNTVHLDQKQIPIDIKETQEKVTETMKNGNYLDDVYNMLGMCKDKEENVNAHNALETIDESKKKKLENSSEIYQTIEGNEENKQEEQEETVYVDNKIFYLCSDDTQFEEENPTNQNLAAEEDFVETVDQGLEIEKQNTDTEIDPIRCKIMEVQYIEVMETEQDQQEETEEIQCKIGDEIIENEKQAEMTDETLSSHSQIKSWQSYTYLCTDCQYQAKSLLDLKTHAESKHEMKHIDKLQFQCYDCLKIIPKYSFYLNHIRSQHHTALKLRCDVCDLNCKNYEELSYHRSLNCSEANKFGYLLSCTQCFKSFHTTYGLQTHNKYQHSTSEIKANYQCTYCGKIFKQKSCLKAHELSHTDKKKYSCDYCDSTFVNKQNLDIHLYSHFEEKTYRCSKCDKRFKTFLTLDRHQDVHSNQKPFKCEFCDKNFRNKSEKLAHERVHTGELPFKCEQCEKSFRYLSALKVHIRNHNGEKPFACDYCDKTFIDTSNRNKHVKRKHANVKK